MGVRGKPSSVVGKKGGDGVVDLLSFESVTIPPARLPELVKEVSPVSAHGLSQCGNTPRARISQAS